MERSELREMAENIAANGYNNMVDETGTFECNMKAVSEGVRMWKELQEPAVDEEDVRRKKLQNDILEKELQEKEQKKMEHHLERDLELELKRIEIEKARLEWETQLDEKVNKESNRKWDRGLKIAGIAVPAAITLAGTVASVVIFKKKTAEVEKMLKLNTILQEKGYISGLNNNKIVESQFNELLKK